MEHMEKRIELEKRGRPAEEILDLNLDNCRSTQIAGLTDEFKNLKSLSLMNVGLTTLKGFPCLTNLQRLELSDNRISNGLQFLNECTKLTYLNLSGNKIKDLETLEPLKNIKTLRNLDLFNCEVTNLENYREKVFEMLTDLQYLDGYDKNDQEQDDDDDDDDEDDEEEEGLANGNGDCSDDESDENGKDDEDEDDSDEDDDEDDDGEVGLSYLQRSGLEEESEGDDFNPNDDDEDDDDDDDLDEEDDEEAAGVDQGATRGVKRKEPDDKEGEDD